MDGYCEHGGTRFPHTPACRRAWLSRRGMGKPGFPIPHPREGLGGLALKRGAGETGFLQTPARWEGLEGLCPPRKVRVHLPPGSAGIMVFEYIIRSSPRRRASHSVAEGFSPTASPA